MAETTGLPFEKKAIIPIDPRTKIFLTVTVSTIMVAGGTGGIMTVIRPCLMAFPMCLLLLSKRWKSVLKFSAMYAVLFALELTVLPLLTGTWNFVLGAAIGIYTHMLPGFIMGYYLIESTTVSEFVAAMERVHIPQGFGIIPTSIFHFRAMDLKIRKIASGYSLAIETLPSISPSTNTTIWSGDFGCFHFKLCKNRLCSMLNSSMFTHTRRQSLPVKIAKAK